MALIYIGDCSLRNQLWYTSWMLSLIGINIFDENWMTGWRIFMHSGLILSCVLSVCISILSFPVESLLNLGKGIFDGYPLFFFASAIFDVLLITWTIYYRKNILKIVETAQRDIDLHSKGEKNAYYETMKDIKIISLAYFLTASTACVYIMLRMTMSKEALNSIQDMFRPGLTTIDESLNHEIMLSFFVIHPFIASVCRCGFLTTYTSLVGNCCCQYKVLTCRMEHLIKEMANPEAATHDIKKILKSTVDSHGVLISTVAELREIYQLIMAANVCFVVTFLIRTFVVRSNYSIPMMFVPFLHVYIYSYVSERLNSERENYQNSIYSSE